MGAIRKRAQFDTTPEHDLSQLAQPFVPEVVRGKLTGSGKPKAGSSR
jgi:hypothetical protein